jgi:hypothetical protein
LLARQLLGHVRRHTLDVLHQRAGISEDAGIDALQDESRSKVRLLEGGAIRIVDVSGAIRYGAQKVAIDFKLARGSGGGILLIHIQGLSRIITAANEVARCDDAASPIDPALK